MNDLRFAFRQLLKNSGFTAVAGLLAFCALEAGAETPPGACTADGRIQEVVYLGPHTRYVVDVGADAPFIVLEQNRERTSGDVQAARGRAVRLCWPRAANRPIGEST